MGGCMSDIEYFDTAEGIRIAYRFRAGDGPAIVFLPGYMSDMDGGKATAILAWAERSGRACLLLDYSGCGHSEGEFAERSLTDWRDEVLALIEAKIDGPVLLVGSSMGGWLMLLAGLVLGAGDPGRLAGLVGIASAPDFTEWGFSAGEKVTIRDDGVLNRQLSGAYRGETMPTWRRFWQSGQQSRLLGKPIAIDCPVRLLHGQRDTDVPWKTSLRLAEALRSDDIQVTLIKDGDHRLSREGDIALLLATIGALSRQDPVSCP